MSTVQEGLRLNISAGKGRKELYAYSYVPIAILDLQFKLTNCAEVLVTGKHSSITFQNWRKPRRNTV